MLFQFGISHRASVDNRPTSALAQYLCDNSVRHKQRSTDERREEGQRKMKKIVVHFNSMPRISGHREMQFTCNPSIADDTFVACTANDDSFANSLRTHLPMRSTARYVVTVLAWSLDNPFFFFLFSFERTIH